MIYYRDEDIQKLNIDSKSILNWVEKAFLLKNDSLLPHKISQTFNEGRNFYNTMPCIIPNIDSAGVKIVSRYPERQPSIEGHLLLYSYSTGELLAMMDATWITTMRTGAVANLAVRTFAKKDFQSMALMGLGQTGKSFLDLFVSNSENRSKLIKLKKYKNHTDEVVKELQEKGVNNIQICDSNEELIRDSDVVVSAITVADNLIGEDEWYKKGVLVVPIHTRGFQNCDLFFDKVFADDESHVEGFRYFNQFKYFNEIDRVLKNEDEGRQSEDERILSYNIGIALHDIFFARKIYDRINGIDR